MTGWLLVFAGLQAAGDTVTLDVATALQRGLEVAPRYEASRHGLDAAVARADQASAWPNPELSVAVENLGQSRAFTGIPGVEGLEAQAIVTARLPVGPERSGAIQASRADQRAASARLDATALQVRTGILTAIGAVLRDQALVASAREEATTLARIADVLALQTESGRAPEGDAARARLAAGMAYTSLARREAAFAVAAAELSRGLGYTPGTVLRLEAGSCPATSMDPPSPGDDIEPPELRLADAEVEGARAAIDMARGVRLPDVAPEIGVRRSGGETGLYLGLSTALPLFDRGSDRVGAAVAEEDAAMARRRDARERWAAARAAAYQVLAALDRAGARFDDTWRRSLEQTVVAAEARYRLGEGTLMELLDSRRARLQALDDYHVWRSEWWAARLEIARLEGRSAPPTTVCVDPMLEGS